MKSTLPLLLLLLLPTQVAQAEFTAKDGLSLAGLIVASSAFFVSYKCIQQTNLYKNIQHRTSITAPLDKKPQYKGSLRYERPKYDSKLHAYGDIATYCAIVGTACAVPALLHLKKKIN